MLLQLHSGLFIVGSAVAFWGLMTSKHFHDGLLRFHTGKKPVYSRCSDSETRSVQLEAHTHTHAHTAAFCFFMPLSNDLKYIHSVSSSVPDQFLHACPTVYTFSRF